MTVCAQTKIELFVTPQNDTLFIMNRAYAELVAMRFDSLKIYKSAFKNCIDAVDSSQANSARKTEIIKLQAENMESYRGQISIMQQQLQSYEREQIAAANNIRNLNKNLKTQRRKTNGVKLLLISSTAILIPSLIYFIIK